LQSAPFERDQYLLSDKHPITRAQHSSGRKCLSDTSLSARIPKKHSGSDKIEPEATKPESAYWTDFCPYFRQKRHFLANAASFLETMVESFGHASGKSHVAQRNSMVSRTSPSISGQRGFSPVAL
jgi:hypothetical protein